MKKLIVLLVALLVTTASYPLTSNLNVDHFHEWFTAHRQNYFVTGFSETPFGNQGKFQISIKAKFLTEDIHDTNLYFSYTQQSFYDFRSPQNTGRPVYESSYMPEVFIRKNLANKENPLKYIEIGLRHHSNGQGDILRDENMINAFEGTSNSNQIDRNWGNRAFLGVKINPMDYLSINYQIWGDSFYGLRFRDDLDDYFGNQELVLALTGEDFFSIGRVTLYLKTRLGMREDLEMPYELSLEIEPFIKYFMPSIYLQWYNGYAESLRFYNEKRNMFRIGFSYPINDLK